MVIRNLGIIGKSWRVADLTQTAEQIGLSLGHTKAMLDEADHMNRLNDILPGISNKKLPIKDLPMSRKYHMIPEGVQLDFYNGWENNKTYAPGERFAELRQQVIDKRGYSYRSKDLSSLKQQNLKFDSYVKGYNHKLKEEIVPPTPLTEAERDLAWKNVNSQRTTGAAERESKTTDLSAGEKVTELLKNSTAKKGPNIKPDTTSEATHGFWKTSALGGLDMFKSGGAGRNLTKALLPGLVGGVSGGLVNAIGSNVLPNNFEYEGMTAPIIKGAIAGVAIGMGRGALSRLGNKYAAHHTALAGMSGMVNNKKTQLLIGGAIGAATWAGTGETHLTRTISG